MFSEAISSICSRWRCSSPLTTASIAGSASARLLVNMGNGASCILVANWLISLFPGKLGDAAGVAATLEGVLEEHLQRFARHLRSAQASAQGDHVRVVVLARQAGRGGITGHGRPAL